MAAATLILDARDIHAWYGSSHVLHGVALQIAKGETVGLLGRNGMGKSTLIRSLLGHVAQRDGQIHLFGRDMSRGKPHEMARLGVAYVPEGRGIFPNLSVRENPVMAARPGRHGQQGARIICGKAHLAGAVQQRPGIGIGGPVGCIQHGRTGDLPPPVPATHPVPRQCGQQHSRIIASRTAGHGKGRRAGAGERRDGQQRGHQPTVAMAMSWRIRLGRSLSGTMLGPSESA